MTRRADSALMMTGLILLAANLTPAVVSTGPVLSRLTGGLGLPHGQVVLLTVLPLLTAAVFCGLARSTARVFGLHRTTLISLIAIVVGTFARALSDHTGVFLFLSALAYAGAATAGTLLPDLIRRHFPRRLASTAALCTATTGIATVLAAALTRPISHADGGWRTGLAVWGALALLGTLPWLRLASHDATHRRRGMDVRAVAALRYPRTWALSVLFGFQSAAFTVAVTWLPLLWNGHGYTSGQAGLLLAVATAVALPLGFFVPAAAMWAPGPRRVVVGLLAAAALGYVLLLVAPKTLALPAALLLGVGLMGGPVTQVLIGLTSRNDRIATALRNAVQATGYLLGAALAALVGGLYLLTGSWGWPLGIMLASLLPQLALLVYVGRPQPSPRTASTAG